MFLSTLLLSFSLSLSLLLLNWLNKEILRNMSMKTEGIKGGAWKRCNGRDYSLNDNEKGKLETVYGNFAIVEFFILSGSFSPKF